MVMEGVKQNINYLGGIFHGLPHSTNKIFPPIMTSISQCVNQCLVMANVMVNL